MMFRRALREDEAARWPSQPAGAGRARQGAAGCSRSLLGVAAQEHHVPVAVSDTVLPSPPAGCCATWARSRSSPGRCRPPPRDARRHPRRGVARPRDGLEVAHRGRRDRRDGQPQHERRPREAAAPAASVRRTTTCSPSPAWSTSLPTGYARRRRPAAARCRPGRRPRRGSAAGSRQGGRRGDRARAGPGLHRAARTEMELTARLVRASVWAYETTDAALAGMQKDPSPPAASCSGPARSRSRSAARRPSWCGVEESGPGGGAAAPARHFRGTRRPGGPARPGPLRQPGALQEALTRSAPGLVQGLTTSVLGLPGALALSGGQWPTGVPRRGQRAPRRGRYRRAAAGHRHLPR